MNSLRWWMRIVGTFYVLQFVANALVLAPIRTFGPAGTLDRAAAGDQTARFLVDTWGTFGLEVGAIGVVLLLASRAPAQAKALVWAVIAVEVSRGIVADVYMLNRGINPTGLAVWIVMHTVVITTGLLALRSAQTAATATSEAPLP